MGEQRKEKKNKREKGQFNTYIIPIMFLTAVIIYLLFSFGIEMITDEREQVTKTYIKEAESVGFLYEKELAANSRVVEVCAKQLADDKDLFDEDHIALIKKTAEAAHFNNAYIINSERVVIDMNNKKSTELLMRESYASMFDSKNFTYVIASNAEGKKVFLILKPIVDGASVKGYLLVEYIPGIMSTLTDSPKYSARRTFMLVSDDGEIIEITGKNIDVLKPGANISKLAENMVYLEGAYSQFKQSIHNCKSGAQHAIYNGESLYIYYTPVDKVKAVTMTIVEQTDVERSNAAVTKNVRSMMVDIAIAIVIFITAIIAISLFNRARYNVESEDLQNKADTDQLTDLYNKMATERLIKEYLEGEGKDSVSMLFVLDVDNFKKINDTRGHAFGDQVLSQLGHEIRAWFRVNDIVGRIGGDEFMVFIKDVKDPEVIKREGSRIKQFFEGFNVGEYSRYSPTASVGGAVYPNDAKDFESLYKAADKAVYKSKREGKNRVSFYGDLNILEKDMEVEKID